MMENIWNPGSTSGAGAPIPCLNSIKSEESEDLVDLQMSDNQKPIRQGPLVTTIYSNSDPFLSSGPSTSTYTTSTTRNSGTMSIYPPFPLNNFHLNNNATIMANPLGAMDCAENSSMDSTSSTTSTSTARSGTEATGKPRRGRLDHLTVDEKLSRRREQNRVACHNFRHNQKAQKADFEATVDRLTAQNGQLLDQQATLLRKVKELQSNLELAESTIRSLTNTCHICDKMHIEQAHESRM